MLAREIKAGGKAEDRWIAEIWSDDCPILTFTPAGRWISITNQIVEQEKLSLEDVRHTTGQNGKDREIRRQGKGEKASEKD